MKSKHKVAIKHLAIDHTNQYSLVQVVRELEIMEFLQKTQMKYFFAGLKHVFSPLKEI